MQYYEGAASTPPPQMQPLPMQPSRMQPWSIQPQQMQQMQQMQMQQMQQMQPQQMQQMQPQQMQPPFDPTPSMRPDVNAPLNQFQVVPQQAPPIGPNQVLPPPPNQYRQPPQKETKAVNTPSSLTQCFQGTAALITTIVVVTGVAACTVIFAVMLSNQNNDVSSQMLVFTGRRTRDWNTANSYSMHSFEEDQYTRFYVCMKSAGVNVPGNPEAIKLYRSNAKTQYDCGIWSDRGWPKDIGFLRCIQKNFNVSFHQSNMFLQCLDLTEGIMLENVQTAASTLFLGSYNYVALLLAAMGVMTGFLIFTAGGIYITSEIRPNASDDEDSQETGNARMYYKKMTEVLKQKVEIQSEYVYVASAWEWVPLAALPNFLAVVWSIAMFAASMFYTYPVKDSWSDTVSIDGGASSFPGTPWTGYLCSGVSFLMGGYFTSCLVEWYFDRLARKNNAVANKIIDKRSAEAALVFAKSSGGQLDPSNQNPGPGPSGQDPSAGVGWTRPPNNAFPGGQESLYSKYPYIQHPKTLGTRYNTQLYYADNGTKDMSLRMTPLLNKVYALAWVFVDGLLFVGMINSQNSPLNENVVTIWFFIILCRAFQFAATYFLDDVLFTRYSSTYFSGAWNSRTKNGSGNPNDSVGNAENKFTRWIDRLPNEGGLGNNMDLRSNHFISFGEADRMAMNPFVVFNNPSNPKFPDKSEKNEVIDKYTSETLDQIYSDRIHSGITVVCCHLASLWCLITVIYHFTNAISIPMTLKEYGVGTDVHSIQICFISFILLMDIMKHGAAFATLWGKIDQSSYWYWMTSFFTADWVMRAVFIVCTIFPITQYFGNVSRELNDYVRMTVA